MIGPPTNSARVNRHPIRSARSTPSSITKFVDANSNAIAAVKFAPLRKSDLANATAAYEHDDDAAPNPQAIAIVRGESSGSSRVISDFETSAWTAADNANPRTSAHRISHVIPNEMLSACAMPETGLNAMIGAPVTRCAV